MAKHKVTFLPLDVTVEVDDDKYPLADHGRPGSLQVRVRPRAVRSKVSSSQSGIGCMTVSSSWKPSARRPRMLSRRLTLQGDGRFRVTK